MPAKPVSPASSLTVSLAAVAILAVAFVPVVAAVRPFLGGWEELPGLFLVFSDQRLAFLFRQLFKEDFVDVVALVRKGEVGWGEGMQKAKEMRRPQPQFPLNECPYLPPHKSRLWNGAYLSFPA